MFKVYIGQPIDSKPDRALERIKKLKELFSKFPNIEVYGAGFGDSPIINNNATWTIKRTVVAYDLRILRKCDIFLAIVDSHTFCAGTMMELEHARQLGIFTIMLSLSKEVKNIFLLTLVDRVVYSIEEVEDILKEISSI